MNGATEWGNLADRVHTLGPLFFFMLARPARHRLLALLMRHHWTRLGFVAFGAALGTASSSFAALQVFYNKAAWEQAVGSWTTVDFVQPRSVFLTDQYADQGLLFPLGDAIAGQGRGPSGDGWALFGASPDYNATLQFTTPRQWFALEQSGDSQFSVSIGDVVIGSALAFPPFTGIISDTPFDRVFIFDGIQVDNVYFGGVPTPSAFVVPVSSVMLARSRRRSHRAVVK